MPRSAWGPRPLLPSLAAVVVALLSGVGPRPASLLQLEAFKQSFLETLGLERPPVVLRPLDQEGLQKAHQVYQEMLAQLRANQTAAEQAGTTIHLLSPKLKHVAGGLPGRLESSDERRWHFYSLELPRMVTLHQDLLVLRAELQFFKEALNQPNISRSNSTRVTHVNIYKMVDGESVLPKLLTSYVLPRASLILDLRDPVDHWMVSSAQRLLLGLEFSADVAALLATIMTTRGEETLPLEVVTQERVLVRKDRQLDEECGKGDGKCCLQSRMISFEDIGWSDWVVAPSSYPMKFCEGSCPQNYKPANMYAQIKYRLHSLLGETSASCCVPAAYEPMVLMHYVNGGKLISQLYQQVIATECHCV